MSQSDNNKSKIFQSVFTRETFGVVTLLFATLCLVCLITGEGVFSLPGLYVSNFLYGTFGLCAYFVIIGAFIGGIKLITGKKHAISGKRKTLIITAICLIAIVGQIIAMGNIGGEYGEYLTNSYMRGHGGFATATFSGIIVSLISYPISALLTSVGAGVILGIILAVDVYFLVLDFVKNKPAKEETQLYRSSYVENKNDQSVEISGIQEYPLNVVPVSDNKPNQKLFVSNEQSFALKSKKELQKGGDSPLKVEFTNGNLGIGLTANTYKEGYSEELKKKIEYIKTPSSINMQDIKNMGYASSPSTYQNAMPNNNNTIQGQGVSISNTISREEKPQEIPFFEHNEQAVENKQNDGENIIAQNQDVQSRAQDFASRYAIYEENQIEKEEPTEIYRPLDNFVHNEGIIEQNEEDDQDSFSLKQPRGSIQDYTDYQEVESDEQTDDIQEIKHLEEFDDQLQSNEDNQSSFEEQQNTFVEQESSSENLSRSSAIGSDRARRILFGDTPQEQKAMGQTDNSTNNSFNRMQSNVQSETNSQAPIEQKSNDSESLNSDLSSSRRSVGRDIFASHSLNLQSEQNQNNNQQPAVEEKPQKVVPPINRKYNRPPLDLLESYVRPADAPVENHQAKMDVIKETLEQFRINAEMTGYVQGPSITRYELKMPAGISVKRVLPYDDDLKMRLESKDGVRIEAPIPGKNLVGIEVANKNKVTVGLKEVLEGSASTPEKKGSLMFAIGKDIVGNSIVDNLAEGPHFLVAGSTGSGKSVCLNLMIVSMIMKYSPEDLRLILVDPKGVEFRPYEHLPHLMIDEIVTEPKKALAVLKWARDEMERRYATFREHPGIVKIDAYNSEVANDKIPKMPRIVIIVDELSNLMESCKRDMEARILSIAQKARAAGIHLVLATQRPSVDVITGVIKANLPSRIALRVMNFADSSTILGEGGAEKLLGNGDMLYKNSGMSECERYQGAYISTREVNNVVQYIIENNTAYFDDELKEFLENETNPKEAETSSTQDDAVGGMSAGNQDLFIKSLWFAINSKMVSISQLQRRFQIGYNRAGAIVDRMERMGYVSPNEGSKARRVLITREQMEEKYGPETSDYLD